MNKIPMVGAQDPHDCWGFTLTDALLAPKICLI